MNYDYHIVNIRLINKIPELSFETIFSGVFPSTTKLDNCTIVIWAGNINFDLLTGRDYWDLIIFNDHTYGNINIYQRVLKSHNLYNYVKSCLESGSKELYLPIL